MMNLCTLSSYFGVNVQSELEKWVEEAKPTKKIQKNGQVQLDSFKFHI